MISTFVENTKMHDMNKISTILVPFDFSKNAKVALEYTVAFVGKDEIKIILVHIAGNIIFKLLPYNFVKLKKQYKGKLKKKLK